MARLADLEEFQKQKEQLMSNMESLEKQLSSQEEKHKATIHSLEMKALLEKKRFSLGQTVTDLENMAESTIFKSFELKCYKV